MKKPIKKQEEDESDDYEFFSIMVVLFIYVASICFYWGFVLPDDREQCKKAWVEFDKKYGAYEEYNYYTWDKPNDCNKDGKQKLGTVILKTFIAPFVDVYFMICKLGSVYV